MIVLLQIIFYEECPETRLYKSELLFAVKDLWFLGKDKNEIKKTLEGKKKPVINLCLSVLCCFKNFSWVCLPCKDFLNTEFLNTSLQWVTLLTMNSSMLKHDERVGTYFRQVSDLMFLLTFYVYLLRFSSVSKSVYNSLIHTTLIHWDEHKIK